MKNPTSLHYVYYHCTKRKDTSCQQKSVQEKNLEEQILDQLSNIRISEAFKIWAMKYLKEAYEKETLSRDKIFESQRKAYDQCVMKIDNLFQLKISPLNATGNLLSDEEYLAEKNGLMKEKARLEEILSDAEDRIDKWLKVSEQTFDFARHAQYWFANGTAEEKCAVLSTIGSNLILKDKKVLINLLKPFCELQKAIKKVPQIKGTFEPANSGLNERKLDAFLLKILFCSLQWTNFEPG